MFSAIIRYINRNYRFDDVVHSCFLKDDKNYDLAVIFKKHRNRLINLRRNALFLGSISINETYKYEICMKNGFIDFKIKDNNLIIVNIEMIKDSGRIYSCDIFDNYRDSIGEVIGSLDIIIQSHLDYKIKTQKDIKSKFLQTLIEDSKQKS